MDTESEMYLNSVLIVSYFVGVSSSRAPTHLLVTRVGPCYDPEETIGKISELSVTTKDYDSRLSGGINISEDISNGWKIKVTMQKCVDIRNIDSCDFFKSFFMVNNGCSADEVQQNLYSTLFNYTSPKIQCPIRAGNYELQNYPFSSDDSYISVFESKISTSVFGYTIKLEGYTVGQKKLFCIETYLQVLYKRIHDWMKNLNVRVTTPAPPDNS